VPTATVSRGLFLEPYGFTRQNVRYWSKGPSEGILRHNDTKEKICHNFNPLSPIFPYGTRIALHI